MRDVESILGDLIALRTDRESGGNKECADYICRILEENGVLFKRIAEPKSGIENIIAGINVQEFKDIQTGLVLSGHFDTVGVNLKDWNTNPFAMTDINGALYGRGVVDMKYFIAVALSLIDELKRAGYPIFLLFSGDEETTVLGIRQLADFLVMHNIKPKYALVGEPTDFGLCVAHKGYGGYTTVVKGVSAHSSRPDLGVNAIYAAAEMMLKIEELNAVYALSGTTLNVGVVSGGVERNSVPSEVLFDWEIRFCEQKHQTEILAKVQEFQKELCEKSSGLSISTQAQENLLAFERQENSQIVKEVSKILAGQVFMLPIATEAGFLQKLGIETLICGAGDIKLAHSASEHIQIADLLKYRDFLSRFVMEIKKDMCH